MANKPKTVAAKLRPALDNKKKEEMLAILIRNQVAFEAVHDIVELQHIRDIGEGHALVWQTVVSLYETDRELPPLGRLLNEVHQAISAKPGLITQEEAATVDNFIDYAFDDTEHGKDLSKSEIYAKAAIVTCRRFLQEYVSFSYKENAYKDGKIPADPLEALEEYKNKLEVIGSLTDVSLDLAYPEGWDTRERVRLFSSGATILDVFMGEGWRGGEVLLFMAPFGSCKTLLTCHAIASTIKHCDSEYRKAIRVWKKRCKKKPELKHPRRPMVVLIFTEGTKSDYRVRVMSNLAKVPWKTLAQMESVDNLSEELAGQGEDTAYELHEFSKSSDDSFLTEQERVLGGAKMANEHLLLIDCTDSDPTQKPIGKGGISEISNIVAGYFRANPNSYPVAFWLDHASALADRICEAIEGNTDNSLLRQTLKRIPRQCRDKLGIPYNAPVAVMHQLSGEANARSSTAKMHHTDGADAKSIAEYVDFAIVGGAPNNESLMVLSCTKHRREPPRALRIAQLDGRFNRVTDASDDYHVVGAAITCTDDETAAAANEAAKIEKKIKKHSSAKDGHGRFSGSLK